MNKDGVRTPAYNLTIPSAAIILMLHIIIYYINIKLLHGLYIIYEEAT